MATSTRELLAGARLGWLDLLARRRRWLVAALLGLAVVAGLQAVRPDRPETRAVWVAATDLAGGEPLQPSQLRVESLPVADLPSGVLPVARSPAGRLLAAPVRAGEPITDVRLLGSPLLAALGPGLVAIAIHVADAGAVSGVVRAGERVDVLGTPATASGTGQATPAITLARRLPVVAVPPANATAGTGAVVIVGAGRQTAALLAAAATTEQLSVDVDASANNG